MSAINDALRRASSAAKSAPAGDAQNSGPAAGGPPPLPPMPLPLPPLPIAQVSTALPPRIDGSESQSQYQQPQFEETAESTEAIPPTRRRRSLLPIIFGALALLCAAGAAGSFLYAKQRGSFLSKYSVLNQSAEETGEEGESTEAEVETPAAPQNVASAVPAPSPVVEKPKPAVTPSAPAPQSVAPTAASVPAPAPAPAPAPIRAPVSFNTQPQNPGAPVQFPPLRLQSIYYRPADPSVMINGKTLYVSDEINGVTVVDISPSSVTLVLSGRTNILTLR